MNIAAVIESHPADKPAVIDALDQMTYGDLRHASASFRGGLLEAGMTRGDRVAIICGNTFQFVVGYLAVVGAGMVAVPLNPLSPAPELERELRAIGARGAIVGPMGSAAVLASHASDLPDLDLLVGCPGVDLGQRGTHTFETMLEGPPAPVVDVDDDTVAVLMFTSGTAGLPKAAMLTHANLEVNHRQAIAHAPEGFLPDDIAYGVLPLFHIFGLNSVLGLSLKVGATVLLAQRFDPESLADAVEHQGVTIVVGPPTMWLALATLPDSHLGAFAKVRMAMSGAAKLPDHVAELVANRLKLHLDEGYGLTEAAPGLLSSLGTDAPRGSVGRPLPGVEMRVVDAEGDDVLIGDAGEIIARGPNIFPGYWNDAEATRRALDEDGWLHTGDIAVVDDNGNISIIDRAKDLIIVSGFNVFPAEVETVLLTHPLVAGAAVTGVSHPHTDEAVKAFVVLVDDSDGAVAGPGFEEEELIAFCRTQLAAYKCPVKVDVVEALPTGLGGKIRRRELG